MTKLNWNGTRGLKQKAKLPDPEQIMEERKDGDKQEIYADARWTPTNSWGNGLRTYCIFPQRIL